MEMVELMNLIEITNREHQTKQLFHYQEGSLVLEKNGWVGLIVGVNQPFQILSEHPKEHRHRQIHPHLKELHLLIELQYMIVQVVYFLKV